ncbi:ABC transporter permease [Odoribacter lunatus]|uniref:ABC transporter permease n=1 Tax=Odoribacter lunatus TaxID=2941335 RepID=UPI002041E830|nr:ABC transporter permease [Odoribacter lunatus]
MNIFKNFSRSFRMNRQANLINMLGLVTGLACCLLIVMWVLREVETDRGFKNIDRIVTLQGYHEGRSPFFGVSPAVAPTLKQERPEVEKAARIRSAARTIKWGTESYNVSVYDADYDLFDLFSLTFTEGRPFVSGEKDRCVLTRKAAMAIFGDKAPLNEVLETEEGNFTVCGIIENLPRRRTVATQGREEIVFIPMERSEEGLSSWYNNSFESYVLLNNTEGYKQFAEEVRTRAMEAAPENELYIKAGHLKERYLYGFGHIGKVRLMGFIALVILLIACINFVNLSTASFSHSAIQTGLRKVIGASRRSLVLGYLGNTFLLVLISYLLALALAYFMVPLFGTIIGGDFSTYDLLRPEILGIGCIILVVTTVLAGIYPSLYLSSFQPVKVLKGKYTAGGAGARMRQMLVVLQFAVSITLVVCTLIVSKQIRMYQTMNLGYQWDEVIYVSLRNQAQRDKAFVLRDELLKESGVQAASVSTSIPTSIYWNSVGFDWEGKAPSHNPLISMVYADENFQKTYDIRLKEGTFFTEAEEGVLVNGKLEEMIGGEVVGKYVEWNGNKQEIIGVVKDLQFNDYKNAQEPLIIFPVSAKTRWVGVLNIRIAGGKLGETYELVRKRAREIFGEEPVVRFLERDVEYWVASERQSAQMVSFFSVLAIVISCLGLFGLATFMTDQKRKEIGIRRVNGAKVSEILWLLNVNFLKPIMVSFLIACPLSYYLMSRWLESYLQRTDMSWWIFLVAGALTTLIAFATLLWRSVKAATENPVHSLKNE